MKTLTTIFKLYLILNLLLAKVDSLTCGEEEIKNCKFCLGGDGDDLCDECEDGYFPLLRNLLCIACDDPIYGHPGCKGNCEYLSPGNVNCFGECKEGFYKNGNSCSKNEGCKNYNLTNGVYKCQECINKDYILESNMCIKCTDKLSHCNKCHFSENKKAECEECEPEFYLNSEKQCDPCKTNNNVNLHCHVCSTNITKPEFCWCDSKYANKNDDCKKCPDGCSQCVYDDSKTDSIKCLTCEPLYTLYSNGSCVSCGDGCQNCSLDQNNNAVCLSCGSSQYLSDENKCIYCPEYCSKCYYDKKEKKPICTQCFSNYIIDNQNKSDCILCENMINNCSTCGYNSTTKQYQCRECKPGYKLVENTHQCLPESNYPNLNCKIEYNEKSNTYECSGCENNYIPVKNDEQFCKYKTGSISVFSYCLEAEKIGSDYSCIKCETNKVLIKNVTSGIKHCEERSQETVFCLEANLEDDKITCTICENNSTLNDQKICQCKSGFVSKDSKKCYKCDDDYSLRYPGCDATKECYYNKDKKEVNCTQCKDGYFELIKGKCSRCSDKIKNCEKCHKDKLNNTLICDSCIGMYIWNYKKGECELSGCEEYSEISSGCIICKDKLDEYKKIERCQKCKYGYFKTKEEKCVYCSSEKYGGPACNYCGYEIDKDGKETDNIICKGCNTDSSSSSLSYSFSYTMISNIDNYFLSSEGKCYNCTIMFSDACTECGFVKNGDNKEILKCLACTFGYYLNAEGYCVSFISLIKRIDHCNNHKIELGNLNCDFSNNNKKESFSCSTNNNYYNNNITFFYPNGITEQIDSKCTSCESGYFLNKNGICEQLNYEKCSFFSLIKNYNDDKLTDGCQAFCNLNNNVLINLKIKENEGIENYKDITLNNIKGDNYNRNLFLSKLGETNQYTLCINNTGENGDLAHCKKAYHFPNNNSYICIDCLENYYLDTDTNLCKDSCKIINVRNEDPPSYICQSGKNGGKMYTLVTYENEAQDYILAEGDLLNCVEARADTTYAKTIYNCTKCVNNNLVPYFNKFYNRTKCVYLNEDITKEIDKNEINYMFYSDKNRVDAKDGICEKHDFFTPDEKFCHKCDSEIFDVFGNPGCKGECDYSTKREHPIRCKGGCKSGYVESSEGYCSRCNSLNEGCIDCSYEEDPSNPNRKGKFDCKFCEGGYMKSSSGECVSCNSLGLPNCFKCLNNTENNGNYVCEVCNTNYFINEEGSCQMLYSNQFKNSENKIIYCNDTSEGGIDNCLNCEDNGERIICNNCSSGYILETESNSCLEIAKNKELQNFFNCEEVIKEDVKYSCTRCKKDYVLVNTDNGNKCLYIPTLYDSDFENHYKIYNNALYQGNIPFDHSNQNDYIYKRYSRYAPCKEATNTKTEDNPLYSCDECYEEMIPDYEAGSNNRGITKIKGIKVLDIHTQVNFCINPKNLPELEHCTEATYEIKKGEEYYNCTTCEENYFSTINKETNMSYCKEQKDKSICQVYFCEKCDENNGNICEECLPDYEVSSISGACIKISGEVPIIIWKDIYNLKLESVKNINNIEIEGPTLTLRGVTVNEINQRHSFSVYLIFSLKNIFRNLQEKKQEIKLPGICEVVGEVEKARDGNLNMVDYECVGNSSAVEEDLSEYVFSSIEEGENNEKYLQISNLYELSKSLTIAHMMDNKPLFTEKDLLKFVLFNLDGNQKIQAKKFKFDIHINGDLSKTLPAKTIEDLKFDLSEVDAKADCSFIIQDGAKAELKCDLNVENYRQARKFSFKTMQINTKENDFYLYPLNKVELNNSDEKTTLEKVLFYGGIALIAVLIGVVVFLTVLLVKKKPLNNVNTSNLPLNPLNLGKKTRQNVTLINADNSTKALGDREKKKSHKRDKTKHKSGGKSKKQVKVK